MRRFRWLAALGSAGLAAAACSAGSAAGSPSGGSGGMTPAAAELASSKVSAAHLRITITTTSDWTQLRIAGGTIEAQRLSGKRGAWHTAPFGVTLAGAHGTSTVTDDLVFSDPTGRRSFTWTIEKGYAGTTRVTVANHNERTATRPASYSDSVHSTSDSTDHRQIRLPRATVMSTHRLALPRADGRRLVLADFYPWWSSAQDYANPQLADRPADERSTTTLAGVESLTAQAKDNGVNGFVVSWDGESGHGKQFALAEQAAAASGQVVTGYLETLEAEKTAHPVTTELTWLAQLLSHDGNRAFLRSGGLPVVFVYQMSAIPPAQWGDILRALRSHYGKRVRLIGDATDPRYLRYEWGLHSYTATSSPRQLTEFAEGTSTEAKAAAVLSSRAAPRAFVGTVSPGFDDSKLRGNTHPVIGRDGGKRYLATWRAAVSGQPDWILVTSWNEWYEDTEIEPGVHTGSQALTQTKTQAAAFSR